MKEKHQAVTLNLSDSPEYTLADQLRMSQARNYFAWQARSVKPWLGQRVVEFGSGIGNFTAHILDRQSVLAVETDTACLAEMERRFPNCPNLRALSFDMETDAFTELAGFHPDSCVCLNVLEHIFDDGQALRGMASILPRGGTAVFIVPAFPALYGPIDANLNHYRRYTARAIRELADDANLEIAALRYMNLVGFFGWWANAHLFQREAQSPAQIDFFDRYIVPALSSLEDWMPPPFGQSLFAVLRKPAR